MERVPRTTPRHHAELADHQVEASVDGHLRNRPGALVASFVQLSKAVLTSAVAAGCRHLPLAVPAGNPRSPLARLRWPTALALPAEPLLPAATALPLAAGCPRHSRLLRDRRGGPAQRATVARDRKPRPSCRTGQPDRTAASRRMPARRSVRATAPRLTTPRRSGSVPRRAWGSGEAPRPPFLGAACAATPAPVLRRLAHSSPTADRRTTTARPPLGLLRFAVFSLEKSWLVSKAEARDHRNRRRQRLHSRLRRP